MFLHVECSPQSNMSENYYCYCCRLGRLQRLWEWNLIEEVSHTSCRCALRFYSLVPLPVFSPTSLQIHCDLQPLGPRAMFAHHGRVQPPWSVNENELFLFYVASWQVYCPGIKNNNKSKYFGLWTEVTVMYVSVNVYHVNALWHRVWVVRETVNIWKQGVGGNSTSQLVLL